MPTSCPLTSTYVTAGTPPKINRYKMFKLLKMAQSIENKQTKDSCEPKSRAIISPLREEAHMRNGDCSDFIGHSWCAAAVALMLYL